MLIRQLPHTLNLKKLTEQGVRLEGELPLAWFTRLLDVMESAQDVNDRVQNVNDRAQNVNDKVKVELNFSKDEQGYRVAQGGASARVILTCQRCLEHYEHLLDVELSLAFVHSEEHAKQLPEIYEPVVVEDENARLVDLIEDDLILALPIVAYHKEDECKATSYQDESTVEEETPKKENPFKVLESLKGAKKDS